MRLLLLFSLTLQLLVAAQAQQAHADEEILPVKARPRMVGEKVPDFKVKNAEGQWVQISSILAGKFTLLAFAGRVVTQDTATQIYFNGIRPYIEELGYQIALVAPVPPEALQVAGKSYSHRILLSDESRQTFVQMGLADTTTHDDPMTTGVFLVNSDQRIIFEFASVRNSIGVSGEVLVLAAKAYRDLSHTLEKKKHRW